MSYDPHACVYCGELATTEDHLIPRTSSGDIMRKMVPTVPACRQCNSILGDRCGWDVMERRALVRGYLRKKHAADLRIKDWLPEEIAQFEGRTQVRIESAAFRRSRAVERLTFESLQDGPAALEILEMVHRYYRVIEAVSLRGGD